MAIKSQTTKKNCQNKKIGFFCPCVLQVIERRCLSGRCRFRFSLCRCRNFVWGAWSIVMSSQLQNLPLRVPLCFPNVATENKKSGNWKSFTRGWSVLFLTAVFKASVGFLVDKGKDKAVERPSEGDITEQKFRSAIVREIDDIKSKLDGFSKKDLLANYQLLCMRKESSCWMKYSIKRCRSEGGEVPVRGGCAEVYSRRKEWETWSFLVNKIKKIKFVFTRVTHNSHTTDKPEALEFPIELEFRNVDFCGGRKTGEPGENPRSKDENQQQTQPIYDTGSGNRTPATLVGGERDHHCAIPASLMLNKLKVDFL